jgi:D-3-phosphoglycerate dehydrogenase
VIGRCGAGLDNIDLAAASEAGVAVVYAPLQNAVSVAELTLALLLALARRLPAMDAATKAGRWDRHAFTGIELYGKTLGIVGLGRIGFLVARRAQALGMRILAHDPHVNPHHPMVLESGAELVELDVLLGRSDVVSCHLPSTDSTRGLFNADRLARFKPGALFLNLARGDVVDEPALIKALRSGRLGGAALDVRAVEPPVPGELERLANVILTPHVAAFTHEAQQRVVQAVCRDVAAVLAGRPAHHMANRPAARLRRALG